MCVCIYTVSQKTSPFLYCCGCSCIFNGFYVVFFYIIFYIVLGYFIVLLHCVFCICTALRRTRDWMINGVQQEVVDRRTIDWTVKSSSSRSDMSASWWDRDGRRWALEDDEAMTASTLESHVMLRAPQTIVDSDYMGRELCLTLFSFDSNSVTRYAYYSIIFMYLALPRVFTISISAHQNRELYRDIFQREFRVVF